MRFRGATRPDAPGFEASVAGAAAVFGLLVRLRFVATLEGSLVLFDSFACRYSGAMTSTPPM
ncbi:hypothetical protein CE91St33_27690 [Eggerthella lenta]|nr:hypothetical protein CE91St33_27690 [Eggerthella lenta]GKG84781.1 hypothetical protein CE91St34_20420 [Eggerthella lenta]GKG88770.1 hypothetical protein CE91St35_29240 [Eggerthella lenta]